jgi:hypothetical protein
MRSLSFFVFLAVFAAVPAFLYAQETPGEKGPGEGAGDGDKTLRKLAEQQGELIEKLKKELADARAALEQLKEGPAGPAQDNPKPETGRQVEAEKRLEGKVTGVSGDNKIVVIDLGKDHDIAEGDVFDVLRDGKKIGSITICRTVDKSISNADVTESDAVLLPGDKVARVSKAERAEAPSQPAPEEPRSELEKLDKRVTTLEGLYSDLARQVERIQKALESSDRPVAAAAGSTPVDSGKETAPAEDTAEAKRPIGLQAKIASVEDQNVFLWVGTNHGVKEGDTFVIQRGDREIAWLRVVSLIKDMCRTVIVSKNGDIQKDGDIATLKPLPPK